jgi:hypothetical protein
MNDVTSVNETQEKLSAFGKKLQEKHQDIYVIIAPPRCSSTAFARVFWGHPSISFYCHEPFDVMYYKKVDFNHVLKALECPLSLKNFKSNDLKKNSLVIKEMTFQVGHEFSFLTSLTKKAIIFLIRDPRLSILSRMKKLIESKEKPVFSLLESGWNCLNYQIEQCKKNNIPYLIVDSKSFRNYPEIVFKKLFDKIEMDFSSTMLHWKPAENLILGNLGNEQKHWYRRILESTSIQVENEPVPKISLFPETNGFRDHVKKCLQIYENLHKDLNIVKP